MNGYAGYNMVDAATRVGCMPHVRRKFIDALRAVPKEHASASAAKIRIDLIQRLYVIEAQMKMATIAERAGVRLSESVPLLNQLKDWLDEQAKCVPPKSLVGKAILYALGQWSNVIRFVDDGRLSIDNNIAERSIKAFVIGRKNWLFSNSVDGGQHNGSVDHHGEVGAGQQTGSLPVSGEVELDGDEWLQLATALCDVTSGQAGLDALELLLSGPASRIADEIGEGPFRPEQAIGQTEAEFIADFIWYLLGEDDGYIRWTVARGLNTLVELGLNDDIDLLLDRFDQREVTALASTDRKLSFQNSQQWLLMGLARVALRHGQTMGALRPKLLALAQRSDLHVIDKVHIARCLGHISSESARDAELEALLEEINKPPRGVVTSNAYPPAAKPASGFRFDYEFTKSEIGNLANLFNIAPAIVEDAIAAEITSRWPEATSMDFFPGRERYEWDQGDRYEFYREHIQRHALLSAATTLSKTLPVVVRSYETDGASPWLEWRDRYDVTFDDGSWLSDRKDPVPQQAKEDLLGKRVGQQEMLQDQQTVLQKLGFVDTAADALLPLYGRWSSPDGVTVSVTSALTERKGAISRCIAFAKQLSHDLWLPEFWDGGYYDHRYRQKSPFAPLVWAPESHSLGIDVGDEIAAEGPGARPRLGIDVTKSLKLVNEPNSGDWRTADGNLALRSQVWGSWKPDPDNRRHRRHEDGEILWASPDWLAATLTTLNRRLVFTVTLWKYRSSRDYDPSSGVKSVLVGLRIHDGKLRLWLAKKASKQHY